MKLKRDVARSPEKLQATYANYFEVGYNAFEFVLGFGQCYEGNEGAELYTKIVTTPVYAKVLLSTLQESIKQYEQNMDKIKQE